MTPLPLRHGTGQINYRATLSPLPLLDLDFKEEMVLEGTIWQQFNVLFRRVIFQGEGLDRRGWT